MTRARELADYGHRTDFKNLIMNGAMDIWQRGSSFNVTGTTNTKVADRFRYVGVAGSAVTVWKNSSIVPDNFLNSMAIEVTTAAPAVNTVAYIRHDVEGYDIKTFLGKYCTLSFWVRSSKPGIYCINIRNKAVDRAYVMEYTIDTINTWEFKEIPFFWDSTGVWTFDNTIGLSIFFVLKDQDIYDAPKDTWLSGVYFNTTNQTDFFDTIGNNILITGIQLEVGQISTPFQFMPITQQLAQCQRFFETSGSSPDMQIYSGNVTSGQTYYMPVPFQTYKRTVPTVAIVGTPVGSNFGVATMSGASEVATRMACAATGTGVGIFYSAWSADAEL